MGDLHAGRDAGRPGGVLQVGDGVRCRCRPDSQVAPTSSGTASTAMTRGRSLAGRLRKNLRTPSADSVVVRIADGWQSSSTACRRPTWPGSDGSNSGTAMRPAVEGAEERDEVIEALRAQDRHPVTRLGDLLQAGADGAVACTEVGPVQLVLDAVALGGEVQESVGELVSTHLGPSLDVTDQVAVVRKHDQSVFEERVMEGHLTLLSKPRSPRSRLSSCRRDAAGADPWGQPREPKPRRSYRGYDAYRRYEL